MLSTNRPKQPRLHSCRPLRNRNRNRNRDGKSFVQYPRDVERLRELHCCTQCKKKQHTDSARAVCKLVRKAVRARSLSCCLPLALPRSVFAYRTVCGCSRSPAIYYGQRYKYSLWLPLLCAIYLFRSRFDYHILAVHFVCLMHRLLSILSVFLSCNCPNAALQPALQRWTAARNTLECRTLFISLLLSALHRCIPIRLLFVLRIFRFGCRFASLRTCTQYTRNVAEDDATCVFRFLFIHRLQWFRFGRNGYCSFCWWCRRSILAHSALRLSFRLILFKVNWENMCFYMNSRCIIGPNWSDTLTRCRAQHTEYNVAVQTYVKKIEEGKKQRRNRIESIRNT